MMARLLAIFFLLLLPSACDADEAAPPSEFDYLTLALSWSPSYCLSDAGQNDRSQCGVSRARPYAFVVHGLWPQFERGYPEYCQDPAPWVEEDTIADAMSYMPSRKLIVHEWRKHGTCYSKDPGDYFAATELLFETIQIPKRFRDSRDWITIAPESLRQSFLSANPQLTDEMISIQCGNRRDRANLREIRICFTKDLEPRACGSNENRQCRAEKLTLPPVRGG